jgi:hypothetical protein
MNCKNCKNTDEKNFQDFNCISCADGSNYEPRIKKVNVKGIGILKVDESLAKYISK